MFHIRNFLHDLINQIGDRFLSYIVIRNSVPALQQQLKNVGVLYGNRTIVVRRTNFFMVLKRIQNIYYTLWLEANRTRNENDKMLIVKFSLYKFTVAFTSL